MPDGIHYWHHDTPKKARVKGAVAFAEYQKKTYGYNYSLNDIFRTCQVSKTRGYAILKDADRRFHNQPIEETRGRKRILSEEDLDKIDRFLWDEGYEARTISSYTTLCMEAGVELPDGCSERTIRRAVGTRDWRKCVACERAWVSPNLAERRVEYARKSLELRPTKYDYRDIRYSDEFHVSSGASGRVWILRKPGERYCPDCIHERPNKATCQEFNGHFWGAIGYNFKSDLYEYRISTNNNGKMTQRYYRDHILGGPVKQWLNEGQEFILEEDGDSGHGPIGDNIVRTWKKNHKLKFYFNCAGSPDLSPIENAWRLPKSAVKDFRCLGRDDLVEGVREGWTYLEQETINKWIDSMPDRFKDVLELDGKMTGF